MIIDPDQFGNTFAIRLVCDFIYKHIEEFARLHPRTEALETPIEDPVKIKNAYGWISTRIKEVDNA